MLIDLTVEKKAIQAFKRRQNIRAQCMLTHIRNKRKIKRLTMLLYVLVWVFSILLMNYLGMNYSVL